MRSFWALAMIGAVGCSGRPGGIELVDVDPGEAAAAAVESCDANADAKLSEDELRAIPGVLKSKGLYDSNSDGFVTEDEFARRLTKWRTDKLGFLSLSACVTLDDEPLSGVHIALTPEPYLGGGVKAATGTTNEHGYASLTVDRSDLPESIKRRGVDLSGVYPGTYKIELHHPDQTLPTVDAAGTPLGAEIARDTTSTAIDIRLKSEKRKGSDR